MTPNKKNTTLNVNIIISLLLALILTIIKLLHTYFGGHLAGGLYSDPHTINEIITMTPSFLFYFIFIFVCCFIFLQIGRKKKK